MIPNFKEIIRNSNHSDNKSHDCLIGEYKGKKIKMTYDAYNASERCTVELFDGNTLNFLLSMSDMGFRPNNSAYIQADDKRKKRADELFKKGKEMVQLLLS
jgi:hypothetical protein